MHGQECPLAALFHKTVAAAVFPFRQIYGGGKAQRVKLLLHEAAEHPAAAYGRHKCQRRLGPAQNIGHIVCTAADGKPLGLRVQVFFRAGQVIHPDDHIHTGRADDEYILLLHRIMFPFQA